MIRTVRIFALLISTLLFMCVSISAKEYAAEDSSGKFKKYSTTKKLILKNIRFEPQLYNWEMDMMSYDPYFSNLTFEIETVGFSLDDVEYFECVDAWAFYFNKFDIFLSDRYSYLDLEFDPETGRYMYPCAEWGTPFFILANNRDYDPQDGMIRSDIYFTTDYITDPEILARIQYFQSIREPLPSIPTVVDAGFVNENYNWEKDSMRGSFSVDIDCEGAENIFYYVYDYRNEQYDDNYIKADRLDVYDGKCHRNLYVDWNEVIVFRGYNWSGVSEDISEPLRVADYIRDPEIKARVDELMDVHTGVNDMSYDKEISLSITDNVLNIKGDVMCISITDPEGRVVMMSNYEEGDISLADLNRGIYIIQAVGKSGNSKTIKYLKK